MTPIEAVLRDVGGVRGRLAVERSFVAEPAELRKLMAKWVGAGWVAWTDRVERWAPSTDVERRPVAAEVALEEAGTSVHVRAEGGGWQVAVLRETVDEAGDHWGFLDRFETTLARQADGGRAPRASYRTWWAPTTRDGLVELRPFASRYVGWAE